MSDELYIEPVLGFRTWRVNDPDATELRSTYVDYVWPVNEARPATHCVALFVPLVKDTTIVHRAPRDGCSCGYYAYLSPDDSAFQQQLHMGGITQMAGIVKGWGKVIVHKRGWRAEFAEPVVLIERHETVSFKPAFEAQREAVAMRYGIPILPLDKAIQYAQKKGKLWK